MGATIERAVRLDTVADDPAVAMAANWRELLDRALEAVERVRRSGGYDLECHRVVVSTHLAFCHLILRILGMSFISALELYRSFNFFEPDLCSCGVSAHT
jgi:hypothetical protein